MRISIIPNLLEGFSSFLNDVRPMVCITFYSKSIAGKRDHRPLSRSIDSRLLEFDLCVPLMVGDMAIWA